MLAVNAQTAVFLQSLLLGMALGLFYDVFRIIRLAIRHSSAIIFLEDMAYFIACAVITFLFALSAVNGHVRVFLVIGEFLGAVIYYFSLGDLVIRLSRGIIAFVSALLRGLYRIFLRPFVRLFRFLWHKLRGRAGKIAAKGKKVRLKAKYSLKRRAILVYNLYTRRSHRGKKAANFEEGGAPVGKGCKETE